MQLSTFAYYCVCATLTNYAYRMYERVCELMQLRVVNGEIRRAESLTQQEEKEHADESSDRDEHDALFVPRRACVATNNIQMVYGNLHDIIAKLVEGEQVVEQSPLASNMDPGRFARDGTPPVVNATAAVTAQVSYDSDDSSPLATSVVEHKVTSPAASTEFVTQTGKAHPPAAHTSVAFHTSTQLPVWRASITVRWATSLPRLDMHGLGRSDPYVVMSIVSQQDHAAAAMDAHVGIPELTCRTTTLFNRVDAVWDETHVLVWPSDIQETEPELVLRCSVWDYDDDSPDDFIGTLAIPLASICDGAEYTVVAPLLSREPMVVKAAEVHRDDKQIAHTPARLKNAPNGTLCVQIRLNKDAATSVALLQLDTYLSRCAQAIAKRAAEYIKNIADELIRLPHEDFDRNNTEYLAHTMRPFFEALEKFMAGPEQYLKTGMLCSVVLLVVQRVSITIYDALLPNFPHDLTQADELEMRRLREKSRQGFAFWKKTQWLSEGQVRFAFELFEQMCSYFGELISTPECETVSKPLPCIKKLWFVGSDELSSTMGTLFSEVRPRV